jgi:hypothetical protein
MVPLAERPPPLPVAAPVEVDRAAVLDEAESIVEACVVTAPPVAVEVM